MGGRILKNKQGMALGVVIGIIMVISVISTAMFAFSRNELGFAKKDIERSQAEYLARAGIEIVAKAFPPVAGEFKSIKEESGIPAVARFYMSKGSDGKSEIIGLKKGQPLPENAIGYVDVNVSIVEKEVIQPSSTTAEAIEVWSYEAKADVKGTVATAKGYSLPTAYAIEGTKGGPENDISQHLGWYNANGQLSPNMKGYTRGTPVTVGPFFGQTVDTWEISYNGVVRATMPQGTKKITVPKPGTGQKNNIYAWGALAVSMESPIDFRNQRAISGLVIAAETIIFDKTVSLYCSPSEYYLGDLILLPLKPGKDATVYFNDDVYFYHGNSRYKIFSAGDSFKFKEEVSLFTYAMENKKLPTGLTGLIREILGFSPKTGKLVPNDEKEPTKNSLTRIIWE